MTDKLQPEHLQRAAYVYVRQSTAQQVRTHRESQQRQYALADRARQLGFARVVVIDEDLGKSGSGLVDRPGFGQLLAAICAGEAGAVLALEASRLARNFVRRVRGYPDSPAARPAYLCAFICEAITACRASRPSDLPMSICATHGSAGSCSSTSCT